MKTKNMGIVVCQKVTNNNIVQFQRIEAEAASREESSQPKKVPLPPSTTSFGINFSQTLESKKRRISGSSTGSDTALEKAFNIGAREQLHSEIARMFYSAGLPFHLARNPYYASSYTFAANHNISGYLPPGYNLLRTTLLKKEKGLTLIDC